MPEDQEVTPAILDGIFAKRRGIETTPAATTPEQDAEARRKAEAAALGKLGTSAEDRASGENLARVHRILTNVVGTLQHGRAYSEAEKKQAEADVLAELGETDAATKTAVRSFVRESMTSVRNGDKASPLRAASDVAEKLAGAGVSPADAEKPDPAALAALIPRS
ncbi:MAG: hypothetical protein WEE66_13635 [Actinomycetota bacterium]